MLAFISYASEDRDLAEQIHLALTGAGHQTFFDKESLPPGGDFHSRIRAAVQQSDLFLFLISPESVAPGSYALTELKYARARWPHPLGHVLPVLVRRVEFEKIPNYLKAVTVLEPEGNLAAEILVAVSDLLKPREGLGGLSKEPSVAAPKELPSAKPALTKSTASVKPVPSANSYPSTLHRGMQESAIWKDVSGLNPYSIGIELESWGRLERKDGAWVTAIGGKKISEAEVVHDPKNETIGWQRFTDAQLRSFFAVACALRRAYPTIEDVVGHSQINPARIDPGPAFPMEEVRRRLFIDAKKGS